MHRANKCIKHVTEERRVWEM